MMEINAHPAGWISTTFTPLRPDHGIPIVISTDATAPGNGRDAVGVCQARRAGLEKKHVANAARGRGSRSCCER
ncbi:MAG: hypothetical protein Ct9H300mP1_37850 [Planctomycetaceae bacterium]|nr:MAG: hypothetical protein Ct9H300mP1_37850 [Planctomycetaceae bacterium]